MVIAHHNCYRCKSINYYDRHIWVQAYQVLFTQYFTHFTRYAFSFVNINTLPARRVLLFLVLNCFDAPWLNWHISNSCFFLLCFPQCIICVWEYESTRPVHSPFFVHLHIHSSICLALPLSLCVRFFCRCWCYCLSMFYALISCQHWWNAKLEWTWNSSKWTWLGSMLVAFCLINIYLNDFLGIH